MDSTIIANCRCGAKINSDTKMRLHKKVCTLAPASSYKSIVSAVKSSSDQPFKSPNDFIRQYDKSLKSGGSSITETGFMRAKKKIDVLAPVQSNTN
jgi:uncharacterized protein YigA (DUF484 family)